MRNQQRIGLLVVCTLVVSAVAAISATPAGTQIQATGTAQYYSTSGNAMPPGSSNVVTTTVMQVASVSLTPTVDTKQGSSGSAADFPLTARNTGNGSDTFDLSVVTQNGSTVTIYKDANGDGVRQSSETTIVTSTGALSTGGTFNCIASAVLPSSKTADVVTVTAKSRYDPTKISTSTLSIQEKASSAYVTSWLINGYYSNTDTATLLSMDYIGGEASISPNLGGMSNGKPWARVDSPTNYVDLAKLYNTPSYCVAYAYACVYSPAEQTVNMWVGSDDGVKIWLNGAVVWTNNVFRAYSMDADKVSVRLPAGWSKLLVKVSQGGVSWGFSVKFCDSQGNAIPGLDFDIAENLPDYPTPNISSIKVTASSTSAIIEWDTDMASDSMVDYWTDTFASAAVDWALVTHHSLTLTGLTPATTYNMAVSSTSKQGMVNTVDGSFQTTTSATPPPASTGAYDRTWLLNGAHPNATQSTRLSTDYLGGESGVNPSQGSVSGGKTWSRRDSTTDYVDLNAAFGSPTNCAAYAFAYVYSPSIQTANLWVGSNDGIKIWLNGAVVWTNDAYRSFTIDKDKTTVTLPAGWSRVLVKISQATGSWGFSFKFCDSSGNALPGVVYALAPASGADTASPVISNIKITPSSTSAVLEWDTNEAATTLVDYGTTSSLGTDYSDGSLAAHHSAALTGLNSATTYYFKVGSADSSGNTAWQGAYTFQTSSSPAPSGSPYIMSWFLNGIYKNSRDIRMSTDYLGGEATVYPEEGYVNGGKTWFRLTSTKSYVDLKTAFNSPTGCAGYAYVYIYSPVAQTANLWMGSDDGIKVWVNGSVVWNNDVYRSMKLDQDKTTVNLVAGWNGILVKVTQADQGWGFSFRVCDSTGNALPGIEFWPS